MFDIGFWELLILGLVALLVVGPERLPKLAYTAGKWIGKGRKMLFSMKAEIDKEIKAEELKEILEEQKKKLNPLQDVVEETTRSVQEIERETAKVLQNDASDPAATRANSSSDFSSSPTLKQPDDGTKRTD